jgi:acylphosphatase
VADILNISCYKFTPLPDADQLRQTLLERAHALSLKGTVLLAEEGINFFLAGPAQAVRSFVEQLKQDPRFADLAPKESWSETVPFRKMLVKVKREIIRMDHPAIRPPMAAPSVSPVTLRRWLEQGHDDEGREVVTLDTRNDYEVDEARLPARSTGAWASSPNSRPHCASTRMNSPARPWSATARAASAAKRPPSSCRMKASKTSTSSKAASSNISRKPTASSTTAAALSLTAATRWAPICRAPSWFTPAPSKSI